jgi:iron complex outermembrane receptor protein
MVIRERSRLGAAATAILFMGAIGLAGAPLRAQEQQPAGQQPEGQQPEAAPLTGAKPAEPAGERLIENLIITGKRRDDEIQQVPISLTQFNPDSIERANLRRLDDVPAKVPNLVFDQGIGLANSARTSLRGLSSNQSSSAADPVIGLYVDGVYRTRLQGSLLSLFDVDTIEVLRGPQGTLFGKNSVGGAINITTKAPDFDFGGMAEVRIGNFDRLEARGVINVPLVPERAAVRLSLATATRDGYFKNVINGDDYVDDKLLSGRLQFLFLPRQDLEVQVGFENSRENRKGFGVKCVRLGPGTGVPGQIANDPRIGFQKACADDEKRSEFKTASDVSFTGDHLTTTGATARVTWDVTPGVTITSISGWRRQQGESFFNVDGTQVNLIQFQNDAGGDTQNQFSQEFRLIGNAYDGRLQYLAGLYGLAEEANEREFFGLGFSPQGPPMGMTPAPIGPNPSLTRNILKTDNRSYALYGQAIYAFTEQLELTLGARLTKDKKRVFLDTRIGACRQGPVGDPCRQGGLIGQGSQGPMSFTGFERTGRFDDLSPSVRLAYAFNPEFLVYTSYSQGFQSGGFDGRAASLADTRELDNQEVTNYEFGLKSTWFDDRVVLNASYFYNLLEKGTRIPVPTLTASGQLAQSQGLGAEALVRGGELEVSLLPLEGLQLTGSLGVQRSKITKVDGNRTLDTKRLPIVPNYTMNFGLDYERPIGRFGTIGLNTSWTVRGKLNPVVQDIERLKVNKYGLLDGRISYELPDGRTEIAAFGTNLLDRRYFNAGFSSADSFGFGVRFFGPPRFYGMELRRSF